MDFEVLESFIAIAEHRSITLASDQLHLSPSALSGSLRKLEEELGYRLFERTVKGLNLTEEGLLFLEWAKKNAGFQKTLVQNLKHSAQEEGVIRIGTAVESDTLFILLSVFRKRYPGIRIELFGEKALLDNYLMSDLDGFVVSESDKRDLPGVLLARRNTLFVLMKEDHPLACHEQLRLRDLENQPFVFSTHDGRLDWTYEYCCAHGFSPNVQFLCEEFDGRMDILANSNTIALGYNTMRLLRESMRGIKAVPLVTEEEVLEKFYLVWRPKRLNPLMDRLIELALEFDARGRDSFLAG